MKTQSTINSIQNEIDQWTYFDPQLFARKLNRAFKQPHIAQAFHEASEAFAAVKRWDSFGYLGYQRVPAPFAPYDGRELLRPADVCTTDIFWWDRPRGRPPLYEQFVCSQGCHWFCQPNLVLAQHLFPDYTWVIVNSPRHSSVVCFEERVVFDLTYFYLGVSMEDCLTMLFGDDYSGEAAEIYDGDIEYSYLDGTATPALHLFKMLDEYTGDIDKLLEGLRSTLDCDSVGQQDNEDDIEMATISTHLMTADRLLAVN